MPEYKPCKNEYGISRNGRYIESVERAESTSEE